MRPREHYGGVIAAICAGIGANTYLELGLGWGGSWRKVTKVVPKCVGVDRNPKCASLSGAHAVHIATTDDFFASLSGSERFDAVFIDAAHDFNSSSRDFYNASRFLSNHGVIFAHDTDPITEDRLDSRSCGDSYRLVNYAREIGFDAVSLPIDDPGLLVARRTSEFRWGAP